MELALNGRTIDLRKALPLLVKDLRALYRRGVSLDKALNDRDQEALFQVMLYVLRKADATITEEEIESLSAPQYAELWNMIDKAAEQLRSAESPLGSTSTSSPGPSTGPNAT